VADPAVIGGQQTGTVTEDTQLTARGQLTITDPDTGESSFRGGDIAGQFGTLSLTTAGAWTYTLTNTNSQVQALRTGQSLTDPVKIQSLDGTEAEIVITINGTDDVVANVINGTNRGQKITGTNGDDIIIPLGGRDVVYAGGGNDLIKATINDGADFYNGGSGSDTVDYSALTQGITAKLLGSSGGIVIGRQSGTDVLCSIENVIGSQGKDTIQGNRLANIIEGGAGNDKLKGGGGSDTFVFNPGFGHDVITDFRTSGPQSDVLQFSSRLFTSWTAVEALLTDGAKGAVLALDADNSITFAGLTKTQLTANLSDDLRFA
jgi:VCBS repeat-containing protein